MSALKFLLPRDGVQTEVLVWKFWSQSGKYMKNFQRFILFAV